MKDILFYGPKVDFDVFDGSAAEYLYQGIRKHPQDMVIQVNGETGESQTLQELLTTALQVGEGLKELGLQQGDVILLVANYNSNVHAVSLAGVLQGMPVFPTDPSFKTLEFEHFLKMSEPKVIFCESKSLPYITQAVAALNRIIPICLVDKDAKVVPATQAMNFSEILRETDIEKYTPPPVTNPKEEVILIVGSSGTTGLPKGVMITHWNFCYQIELYKNIPTVPAKCSYLQVTHNFWVTGLFATFFSCFYGVERVYVGNTSGSTILKAIHKFKPQWAFLPPIHLIQMLDEPDFEKCDVSSLKLMSTGGSMLPKTTADKMKCQWPGVQFGQSYGMTELTGGATTPAPEADFASAGKLMMGMMLRVSDVKTGASLGANQFGEFLFKSDNGVMRGYMRNEQGTKEALTEDGFYRSGDLGHISEDGFLFITDRIKELIKCKNHQVGPTELEEVIRMVEGVYDVGVVGVPHEVDQYRPTALVVRKKTASVTEQQIVDFVKDKLSEHKQLYGGVRFVDAIPRTPNGKIKRNMLKEMVKS